MSKKSKYATGKTFTSQVCDAIRHHVGSRIALESKRKNAFEDRDAVIEELSSLSDRQSPEAVKLKARHSDAILEIEALSTRIKWHSNQIDELVEKADEPEFDFQYDMPDEDEVKDDRPVGSPKNPPPKKGGLRIAGGETPADGVDQQLAASVRELDCRENLHGKLIAAGFKTVKDLADYLDAKNGLGAMMPELGKGDILDITKALAKYRQAHRSAILDADREGRVPKRSV